MSRYIAHSVGALAVALVVAHACSADVTPPDAPLANVAGEKRDPRGKFEVWLVDQSNSPGLTYGGMIHIYNGRDLTGAGGGAPAARAEVVDLAQAAAALCFESTGAYPVRPHMLFYNSTHEYAVLSFVASGHVVVFDAAARRPKSCLRSSIGTGGARQAHAAIPAPDDSFILVANQNGKLLERIRASFRTGEFALEPEATLDLTTCTTPNGFPCQLPGVRPDNAPICAVIDGASRLAWVTLRGGGLFVVDARATPMRIVAEYDRATVHGNGCGGTRARGSMYINSGGGTADNLNEFDLYRFPLRGYSPGNPPNVPAPALIFSADAEPNRDAHGVAATKHDSYLWVADRAADVIEVFDVATGKHAETIDLVSPSRDNPTPDLLDLSPDGSRMFASLRGPNPLSGDHHVSTGTTPGLAVIRLTAGGRSGVLTKVLRVSNVDASGVERADPHAVRVRKAGNRR